MIMKETEKEKNKYAIIAAILFSIMIALFGFMRSCLNNVATDVENRKNEKLVQQIISLLPHEQRVQLELARQIFQLNGEIVANNVIVNAPQPYYASENHANFFDGNLLAFTIVPFQPIAKELGYEVSIMSGTPLWGAETTNPMLNISVGNASFDIGKTEVRIDGNPAFELLVAPYVDDNGVIFVPLNFFRDALGKTVYIFEGQVVIETYSDMR